MAFVAACDGTPITGVDGPSVVGTAGGSGGSGGGSGTATLPTSLVGTWYRVLWVEDAYGGLNASETYWRLGSDGAAKRTVVATNFDSGYRDTTVVFARWHVEGTTLVIEYTAPDHWTARIEFRIEQRADGPRLYLGDAFPYQRVAP